MVKYKHVISLGWFCSVAEEMERIGLRNASYPFDWILSDFKTVYDMAEGKCNDFLTAECLAQDEKIKNMYRHKNRKCLTYIHDICPYSDYEQEIEKAREKYNRRLRRFRQDIREPSIFIRYIMDEEEYHFILEKWEGIGVWLKTYHPDNQIIFIANDGLGHSEKIWSVCKDSGDSVARRFLQQVPELQKWLLSQEYDFSIEENLEIYRRKQRKKKIFKYPKKIQNKWRQLWWLLKGFK